MPRPPLQPKCFAPERSKGSTVGNAEYGGFSESSARFPDLSYLARRCRFLDPMKVVRTALTNAGSISSLMLTTKFELSS
jgi:hypothetical protein